MIDLEKIKRYIVNGEVVHKGEFWRRGRKLSQRLEQIVIESKLNLRDIAFKYSAKIEEGTQCGPLYRETSCRRNKRNQEYKNVSYNFV
ncbi:hypothetical protein LEP1GSC150_0392 [Leptospira interrogans serovar Copenhageni str. LT2050]|uniref:Uncharacterized protein n=1 Tax=Leptospira interrogans serovar Copenhageni str. LT2050 TaxID=1001598 RepID=M3IPS1_LEPIT|nr:hypothetical protein LEP1GSC150_0392 [Leptospira interrogans serovar Copenhageni str. LT2050]